MNSSSDDISTAQKIKAKSLFNKATALEEDGKSEEAIEYYKQAFKLDPKLERGDVNYEDDEIDEEAAAKKVLQENNNNNNNNKPSRSFQEIMEDYMTVNRSNPPSDYQTFDASKMFSGVDSASSLLQKRAKEYLESEGYVVFDNVLNNDEIKESLKYFALFLENAIDTIPNVVENPKHVIGSRLANPGNGIVAKYGAGQSRFNWFIRSRKFVKDAFRNSLWGPSSQEEEENKKMITSFDGFNFIVNEEADSEGGGADQSWLHFDYTGSQTANYLQGLVNILDSTPSTEPSFVVFPKSNRKVFPHLLPGPGRDLSDGSGIHFLTKNDFIKMADPVQLNIQERPFRVPLKPGSLVIWKSSTLHCGIGCAEEGRKPELQNPKQVFRRIASYVCMMKDPKNEEVTATRRDNFFKFGISTGHQPDYGRASSGPANDKMKSSGAVIVDEKDLFEGAKELL